MVKKVGLPAEVFMSWPGGVDLITQFANAMALNPGLKLFLLVPVSTEHLNIRLEKSEQVRFSAKDLARHLALKVAAPRKIRSSANELKKGLNKKVNIVYYASTLAGFLTCIKSLRLDVVMPTTESYGTGFPIPWVGYIWDFQHKYYPQFFTKDALAARDKIFKNTLSEAPSVIVNSEEVRKDARRFYKFEDSKIVVLPFAPQPRLEWFEVNLDELRKKYGLPQTYLIVSNQFWLHKSHVTAVDAMSQLLKDERYSDVHLLCTGKMEEPRKPEYIEQLRVKVAQLGLDKNIRFLGYIPKLDQVGIMRGARAVIQPTLFEGGRGGGAADNAIALGIPLIVSDISINKELIGSNIIFFKAGSAKDLVKKIMSFLNSSPNPKTKAQLILQGKRNQSKLCRELMRSIKLAENNFSQERQD